MGPVSNVSRVARQVGVHEEEVEYAERMGNVMRLAVHTATGTDSAEPQNRSLGTFTSEKICHKAKRFPSPVSSWWELVSVESHSLGTAEKTMTLARHKE